MRDQSGLFEWLLRVLRIGKEPAEAHNFTRGEQLRGRWYGWGARQDWLPSAMRLSFQLQHAAMTAMAWPLAMARVALKEAERQPARAATDAEMQKISGILNPGSDAYERFGWRPATLADFGKDKPSHDYYHVQAYSGPLQVPTYWQRIKGWAIWVAIRWICRSK